MKADILAEILDWSHERPLWQREALRRIFTGVVLDDAELTDLTDICKSHHGLSPYREAEALAEQHLAIAVADAQPVTLKSVTHHTGVNALAPEQTVSFGPSLTVVYGENGAGKSGYTRILKRACRARMVENVLGDVLSTATAPLAAKATIRFKEGATDAAIEWGPGSTPSSALAALSVFDSHCAPVYLRDKTDVAFRPFGLDVFDKLAAACADVRRRLENEMAVLTAGSFVLPTGIVDGTKVRRFVDSLTALTKDNDLVQLSALSTAEEERLKDLLRLESDAKAANPVQRAGELIAKAVRIESVAAHIANVEAVLGIENVKNVDSARTRVRVAKAALSHLRNTTLGADLIPGTGDPAWRTMWASAGEFSSLAYPGRLFPVTGPDAKCPLCQQSIGSDAASRLAHLAEFATSTADAELRDAERAYQLLLRSVANCDVSRSDIMAAIDELKADDESLASRATGLLAAARDLQAAVAKAGVGDEPITASTFDSSVVDDVKRYATSLRTRGAQLKSTKTGLNTAEQADLDELRSRVVLRDNMDAIKAELERKRRISAYRLTLEDTVTNLITKKSTELTKRLVTDQLSKTFQSELQSIKFGHLSVEIQAAGGAKGALFHKLVFSNAPNIKMTDVLSEGESRALSLAAFMTELSTAPTRSGIVFDDPVSSLDHRWRRRIADRLVAASKERQVVVFTHDLLLLSLLMKAAERADIECHHQYIRHEGGQPGVCSPDLPWVAMSVKERIGVLRNRWVKADKTFRLAQQEAYEREAALIYASLRETWERGVAEVLLNDVVEPYRPDIETQKAKKLIDITEQDFKAVDDGMSECSRWMRGHDAARADGDSFPDPTEVKQRIDELEAWTKAIRKRRS